MSTSAAARRGLLAAHSAEKEQTAVDLELWGSIGSAAVVEAFDKDGQVVDTARRDKVPEWTGPEKLIPSFELTVKGPAFASVRFSGALPGGYLVCDEVRFSPRPDPAK